MPYKFRASKKKQASLPIQEIKGRFDVLRELFLRRPLLIFGTIAILAVILISVPAYRMVMRQSEDRAWALEIEASHLFHEKPSVQDADKKDAAKVQTSVERLTKASILYDDILKRYPESGAAKIAQFEGGNVYFELEKYDLAEQRYLAFLKKETERKDLLPLVHLRLAYLYQNQKKDGQALDHFRIAYEWEGGLNKDQAGFERGSLLERIGQIPEAIETYKKVSDLFKDSPWGTEAKARLAGLTPSTATSTPADIVTPVVAKSVAKSMSSASSAVASKPTPIPAKVIPKTAVVVPPISSQETPKSAVVGTPTPTPPVPIVPSATPSTAVPLEITPDQLRMLREKGSLTIPLPPQESEPKKESAPAEAPKP